MGQMLGETGITKRNGIEVEEMWIECDKARDEERFSKSVGWKVLLVQFILAGSRNHSEALLVDLCVLKKI